MMELSPVINNTVFRLVHTEVYFDFYSWPEMLICKHFVGRYFSKW